MVKYSKALHFSFSEKKKKKILKWFCSTVAYHCCGEENHGIIETKSSWRICWFISEPFLLMFSDSLQLVYLFPCKFSKLNTLHQLEASARLNKAEGYLLSLCLWHKNSSWHDICFFGIMLFTQIPFLIYSNTCFQHFLVEIPYWNHFQSQLLSWDMSFLLHLFCLLG